MRPKKDIRLCLKSACRISPRNWICKAPRFFIGRISYVFIVLDDRWFGAFHEGALSYLQASKIRQRLREQKGIDLNVEDAALWEKINDTERFKLLQYLVDDGFQFADLIAQSDGRHLLSYANDGENNTYLYYEPSYPWEREEEEFRTEEEAKEYISSIVMPFVGDQVTRKDILALIGEICEVGCG